MILCITQVNYKFCMISGSEYTWCVNYPKLRYNLFPGVIARFFLCFYNSQLKSKRNLLSLGRKLLKQQMQSLAGHTKKCIKQATRTPEKVSNPLQLPRHKKKLSASFPCLFTLFLFLKHTGKCFFLLFLSHENFESSASNFKFWNNRIDILFTFILRKRMK